MIDLKYQHIATLYPNYDLLLFDLWGVIVEGNITYPGVVDTINNLIPQKKVCFVSNAPRPNYKSLNILKGFGLKNINQDMIVTSGDIAREILNDLKHSIGKDKLLILHLGQDRNEDILHNIDHKLIAELDGADVLLLSLYRDEGEDIGEFDDILKRAANADIPIICSNPDTIIPKQGISRYCAGHFASIIEKNGGNVIYTGKPRMEIYNKIFELHPGIEKNKILMIGDTFETDILGAQNAGIHSAIVLTGNSLPYHQNMMDIDNKVSALKQQAEKFGIYPTYVTSLT